MKQIRPEKREEERKFKPTGQLRKDLETYFRTFVNGPMDAFFVDKIMYMVLKGKTDDKEFMALLKDCCLLPKDIALLKRKVQTVDTYDPERIEKKRKELIRGNGREVTL